MRTHSASSLSTVRASLAPPARPKVYSSYATASFSLNSSAVMGDENMPKVPVVAAFCLQVIGLGLGSGLGLGLGLACRLEDEHVYPSSVIVAMQSISVITCNRQHQQGGLWPYYDHVC